MYARYTITFEDFLREEAEWWQSSLQMSTVERTKALHDAIVAQWWNYEIGGETIGEMKRFLQNTFAWHKRYYEEMLDAYEKKWDYEEGLVRKSSLSTSQERTGTGSTTSTTKGRESDLPNTKVSPDAWYDMPTTTTAGEDEANTSTSDTTTGTQTRTDTDNSRYITLRTRWMNQIRDLYREFADRFADCFVMIY